MLSFELSVTDIVLAVAVIVLLLLSMIQRRSEVPAKSQAIIKENESLEEPKWAPKTDPNKLSATSSGNGFQKCIHRPGHLATLPKNIPVPDECFGCPKTLHCLFPNEQHL